jgi:hypothetical protein
MWGAAPSTATTFQPGVTQGTVVVSGGADARRQPESGPHRQLPRAGAKPCKEPPQPTPWTHPSVGIAGTRGGGDHGISESPGSFAFG